MGLIKFIDRKNTDCYKWDYVVDNSNFIPLWIADTDFETPEPIVNAIINRAKHPAYGYVKVPRHYLNCVVNWYKEQHQWSFSPKDIIYTIGVVPAISAIIKAVANPINTVIMFTPVYNCFYSSVKNNGCQLIESELKQDADNVYHIDFEDFEDKCKNHQYSILLLCNPHNPVSRAFTINELEQIAEICKKYSIFVIADEIHCEIVMPGYKYIPFGTIADKFELDYAVCNSQSKTFNIASLQMSNIICKNKEYRTKIERAININECCDINPFGLAGNIEAYSNPICKQYITELNLTIYNNYKKAKQLIEQNSNIAVTPLEATYLMWIKCPTTKRTSKQIEHELLSQYNVWLCSGTLYGNTGEGYMRINLATKPELIEQGITKLLDYYNKL